MKKLIILIQITTIFILINLINNVKINSATESPKFYYMTSTAYSRHSDCIADKFNDGLTATGTPIREGVAAINVDWIDKSWTVKSPLRLGQSIYVENVGRFEVEDTGYFTEEDFHFDFWNLDIYFEDHSKAKEWGIKKIKVIILKEE